MLSYQHAYHAGNFADVQKHAILVRVLKSMLAKPQPMTVLDTHAGRGLYDLSSDEAQKTGEYQNGILPLWEKAGETSTLSDYFALVKKYNRDGVIRHYPGTAAIARDMLRPIDKLACIEMHPAEFKALQQNVPTAITYETDGFMALVDSVPLPARRGLVVVDPSYEIKTEYETLPRQLLKAWKKWPQGVYMIWYPMLESLGHRRMLAALRQSEIKDVLISEIRLDRPPQDNFRMYGTGIALINPPWPEKTLDDLTQYIARHLPMKAFGDVFWLDNKKINPDSGYLEL